MTLKYQKMSTWAQIAAAPFLLPFVVLMLVAALLLIPTIIPIAGIALLDGGKAFFE